MKEFALIFRRDIVSAEGQLSPEQLQKMSEPWKKWMSNLAAQNKLANPGNRLGNEGKIVKPGKIVTNGPYAETKEAIGGYIVINANSIDEASEIAKGCPILDVGGNVEVRPVVAMDDNN